MKPDHRERVYTYATSRDDVHRQMREMADVLKAFDPDQPRDERGRWTGGGAGAASTLPPTPGHNATAHDAVSQVPHTRGEPKADGSLAHPIYVDGDLDRAVREIHAGRHVRLDQSRQVVTLVDKLGDMAEDAVAKGEQAPTYDLGLVTIPGTNLFTQQSLGIPRVEMPQLSGPPLPGTPADKFPKNARGSVNLGEAFRDELEHQGYKVTDARIPAESLRATQMDLVGPQVAGMADALEQGKLNIRPIFVSNDDYVVDGHHQWAATVLANLRAGKDKFDLPVQRVDADIGTILDTSREYTKAMGLPQKAGTAKTVEAIQKLIAEQRPGEWVHAPVDGYTFAARVRYANLNKTRRELKAFDESQPRDEQGRWTASGTAEDALSAPPKGSPGRQPASLMGQAAHALDDPNMSREQYKGRITDQLTARLKDNAAYRKLAYHDMRLGAGSRVPMTEAQLGASLQSRGFTPGTLDYEVEMERPLYALTSNLVHVWANTSGDNNPISIAIQHAVQDEFKLSDSTMQHMGTVDGRNQANVAYQQNGEAYRAFVRAMYDNTQAELQKQGISEMQVYRGMDWSNRTILDPVSGRPRPLSAEGVQFDGQPHAITTVQQPASSWTYSFQTAKGFAAQADAPGALFAATVPASRILSTMKTGWGCKEEKEVVVLGGKDQVGSIAWNRRVGRIPTSPHELLGATKTWARLEIKGVARWQLGKLMVDGREVPREHPDYYRLMREIPQIKRYRLMVGGEDLLTDYG